MRNLIGLPKHCVSTPVLIALPIGQPHVSGHPPPGHVSSVPIFTVQVQVSLYAMGLCLSVSGCIELMFDTEA